jgi:hypothetical protein
VISYANSWVLLLQLSFVRTRVKTPMELLGEPCYLEMNEARGKGGGFGSSAKFLIGSIPQRHQLEGLKDYLDILMDLETLQELTYDMYRWY